MSKDRSQKLINPFVFETIESVCICICISISLGMPLNVSAIILSYILSMVFGAFNALGPKSIHTPPTVALTEFFHADTVASVHPLPVSWYLISSVCVYLCSCMHIMSILYSWADAVSSGSWPILFKVLNAVSSRQRSCRYYCMDAPLGRWRRS